MTIVVRAAGLGDIPRVRWLESDAGERFREVGLDAIADSEAPEVGLLAHHVAEGTCWVAVDGSGPAIGYAIASAVDGEGHLDQVSVARRAMGRGVGSALIEEVCRWAAAQGFDAVTLTTFRDIDFNGPYYERRGFVVLDEGAWGPQLSAIRARERQAGLDVAARVAMRRALPRQP